MDKILKQYREELVKRDYTPGLCDYLTQLASSSLGAIDTLNSFTDVKFVVTIAL